MFLLNECSQCCELDQETRLTPGWSKISVTGQSSARLQADGILLDPQRSMVLGPELDCTETCRLNHLDLVTPNQARWVEAPVTASR